MYFNYTFRLLICNLKQVYLLFKHVSDSAVRFEMLYCGICHSDVHTGVNDWGPCNFPFVGGHELLGRVVEVGSKVNFWLSFSGSVCIVFYVQCACLSHF